MKKFLLISFLAVSRLYSFGGFDDNMDDYEEIVDEQEDDRKEKVEKEIEEEDEK